MATDILDQLFKLPSSVRAELAMALWDSLDDADHEATVELTDELRAELDRRWASYQANPGPALSLDELVRRLEERRWPDGSASRSTC